MPADSAIKQLNLKAWAGKVKVAPPQSSYLGDWGAEPTCHFPPSNMKGEKQNPAKA